MKCGMRNAELPQQRENDFAAPGGMGPSSLTVREEATALDGGLQCPSPGVAERFARLAEFMQQHGNASATMLHVMLGEQANELEKLGWLRREKQGRWDEVFEPAGALAEILSPQMTPIAAEENLRTGEKESSETIPHNAETTSVGTVESALPTITGAAPALAALVPDQLRELERIVLMLGMAVEEGLCTLDLILAAQHECGWPDARVIERVTFRLLKLAQHFHAVTQNRQMMLGVQTSKSNVRHD